MIKASDADSSGMMVVHHPLVNSNGEEATVNNRLKSPSEQNMVNGVVKGAIDVASPSLMRYSELKTTSLVNLLVDLMARELKRVILKIRFLIERSWKEQRMLHISIHLLMGLCRLEK